AKLVFCGAGIAAIGWGVGVFGPTGQVAESHADITWLSPAPRTSTAAFQKGLQRLGHKAPQVFDLNGNTIQFSVAYSDRSPQDVMRDYQEEFVRQGINSRVFLDVVGDQDEMMTTVLGGGIIPLSISKEAIVMGGMVTQNREKTKGELKALLEAEDDPHNVFRGHRHIEISRQENEARTTIVSTWSDEDFDYGKMVPGKATSPSGADPVVPACLGCTRLSRFEDLDRSKTHVSSVFAGSMGVDETRRFYDQAMRSRGWEPTDTHHAMATVTEHVEGPPAHGQMLQYVRDGQFLTIVVLPDGPGQTKVMTTQSD
ncbi:MAG: hypothetical protein ACNA8W_17045, partial [Bradymonadaceae bacterium]